MTPPTVVQQLYARLDKGAPIPGPIGPQGPQGDLGPMGPQGPPGPIVPATTTTIGAVIIGANVNVQANGTISTPMASVFGRTGAVVAASGDYDVAQVSNAVSVLGSYTDPPWIAALAWTKMTGAPAAVPPTRQVIAGTGMTGGGALIADVTLNARVVTVFGRIGAVAATAGDYTAAQVTNAVATSTQTYANPPWVTALAWAKIVGPPSVGSYQTPWVGDISAAGKSLSGAANINATGTLGIANIYITPVGTSSYPIYIGASSLNKYGLVHQEVDPTGFGGFAAANDLGDIGGVAVYGSTYTNTAIRRMLVLNSTQGMVFRTNTSIEVLRFTAAGDSVLANVKTAVPTAGSNIIYKDASGFLKIA